MSLLSSDATVSAPADKELHRRPAAADRLLMDNTAATSVFGIRYDIDTILPKYRDIDIL